MKTARLLEFILIIALLLSTAPPASSAPAADKPWQAKVDAWVLESAAQGDTEFLLFLTEQADLSGAAQLRTKAEKGAFVYRELTRVAERSQGPVLQALAEQGAAFRPYWVANLIWVRGPASLVQAMAERSDIAHLYANPKVKSDLPVPVAPEGPLVAAPATIEWNILKVRAPDLWALGITGQNVVIGGQDTGYQWDHPGLKNQYRGWNGSAADHNYNWHDAIHTDLTYPVGNPCGFDTVAPCDDYGHGTHTMGTMVGDDGLGNQVGMAPGVRWIGCRNMEEGVGTPDTYIECYQWFMAPTDLAGDNPDPSLAPDVINNSWGCPTSEGCTDPNVMLAVVEAVRAAGILTVHAAGNAGPSCYTVRDPAAIYDASFTVANTTSSDTIASSSSRGTVTVDGSNRLKPDISAPGSNIRSTVLGGGYSYSSGTSMAAPHVAGLAALLISAQPQLNGQVDALEDVITHSAKPLTNSLTCGGVSGSEIPNPTFGWGRIDAWQAYQRLLPGLRKTAPWGVLPGQVITYTLTVSHTLPILLNFTLTDTLPANTTFLGATPPYDWNGSVIRWQLQDLSPFEGRSVTFAVRAPDYAITTITNQNYGTEGPTAVPGSPVNTLVAYIIHFPFWPNLHP